MGQKPINVSMYLFGHKKDSIAEFAAMIVYFLFYAIYLYVHATATISRFYDFLKYSKHVILLFVSIYRRCCEIFNMKKGSRTLQDADNEERRRRIEYYG